jgi:hypothetical protein
LEDRVPAGLKFTATDGRKFAFPVGTAFLVFAAIAYWRHADGLVWKILAGLGGGLWVLGLVMPGQLGPVYRGWMGFAKVLSKFTTPIVMGVIYYVVFTPVALFMRMIGRQPMKHPEKDGGFWADPHSGGRSDMTHQF